MADASNPMIKLEPGGQAPILSYNVPEPTSYSGRNFIELRFPAAYYVSEVSADEDGPNPGSRGVAPVEAVYVDTDPILGRIRGAAGVLRLLEEPEGAALVSGEALSPRLAGLRPDDVIGLAEQGQEVTLYRSMFGTLSYAVTAAAPRQVDDDGGDDAGGGGDGGGAAPGVGVVVMELEITAPLEDDIITGPEAGVDVAVEGTAGVLIGEGDVTKVEVRVGTGGFQEATPGGLSDWSQWSATVTLTQSGLQEITARATHVSGKTKSKSVTIRVALSAPPGNDTTPPQLTITSPPDGAVVTTPVASASVNVEGTAFDAQSGVKLVELTLDGAPASTITATPASPDDWSTWAASLSIDTPGTHTVTARCEDKAGREAKRSLTLTVAIRAPATAVRTSLVLVETYRLSSFLGTYGAGRTIKTFSLLPGEKTKISVKSFTRSETEAKSASSILDSFTQDSADDFESTVGNEQTNKEGYDESFKYKVGVDAQASWGFGSARVSAEASGATNASREEFAKNVSNATQKHTAKASAKRDVQINTDYVSREEAGEETSTEREIANINVGRTLNFVFRQMNQEFITILHLVDVRVGLFRSRIVEGKVVETWREASLPELDTLLADAIVPGRRAEIRDVIRNTLSGIPDYNDELKSIVQVAVPKDENGNDVPEAAYLRVDRRLVTTYEDPTTGTTIPVAGLILSADKSVLRTEGVIVEALLGQGEGLDEYSRGLQETAVLERQLENARIQAEIDKGGLARELVEEKNAEGAEIFEQVFPPPVEHQLEPSEDGAKQPV